MAAYAFEQMQGGFQRKFNCNPEKLDAQKKNNTGNEGEGRERNEIRGLGRTGDSCGTFDGV